MNSAVVQTLWSELMMATLADAGVSTIVISPGSRSTPLVAALDPRLAAVTIIDERAAGFYALGAARATGLPVALLCTSGTAAAHYLPALVEASLSGIPLIAITADRPPELLDCGASQTIDQVGMYGRFARGAFDLGAPVGTAGALRGLRRKVLQAITLARGPHAGPVHLEVPLRKPLEPALASTDEERGLARVVAELRGPALIAPPTLAADRDALAELAAAIAAEPDGVIIAGALPVRFAAAREAVLALAEKAGYPILAEAGSQLRFGAHGSATVALYADLIPVAQRPAPRLVLQLGAEPVAASWPAWQSALTATTWVLAERWADPTSSARVILGDVAASIDQVVSTLWDLAADRSAPTASFDTAPRRPSSLRIRTSAWLDTWKNLDARAATSVTTALAEHPRSEGNVLRAAIAALPAHAALQIGNSMPIRVVDQVAASAHAHPVLTQRGAAGIDGLIASAAGATRAGAPVLLVLGDVSFAHDLGGLLAARTATAPLAILVIDNRGGQIFAGLPIARTDLPAATLERHWLTPPEIDPSAIATALGARALTAASPSAVASAIAEALGGDAGVTVIHAPVSTSGAHDVRRSALELFATPGHHAVARSGGIS